MAAYDLGDDVTITTTVTDVDGTLTNTTMVLTVTAPDGTTSTPSVTNPSTGNYSAVVSPDQVGTWFYKWVGTGTVVVADSGRFTVADPAPATYATLAEFKKHLRITDTTDDAELLSKLITATSRIDDDCGRTFQLATTTSQRIFNIEHDQKVIVDDIATATGLVVEAGLDPSWGSISSTAYRLRPDNAIAKGRPAWLLEAVGWYRWPLGWQIRVTAQWGWPTVPDNIHDACLILAARLWRRKDSPEGTGGFSDLGTIRMPRYDSDYDNLIARYVKVEA